ncbi:MAG: hypothetical protein LC099_11020 [Anaerolineales bacterium]|nr:hypothetical protein [Anaerolineales bacterium]
MTTVYEEFVKAELAPHLEADETINAVGFLFTQSPREVIRADGLNLMGGGYYFAALASKRILLLAAEMGFFSLKMENKGVSEIAYDDIQSVRVGGFLNQKWIVIVLTNGERINLRLNALATRYASGQKEFIKKLQERFA